MTLPTIHLNGTSKEQLVAALCSASYALDNAYAKLKETAPNGRDYYPQGQDAMPRARKEHDDRMRRLDGIKDEIDEMALAIDKIANRL